MKHWEEYTLSPERKSESSFELLGGPRFTSLREKLGVHRGDIGLMNLKDPSNWVMEHVLPGVGGRTLGGSGHSDIIRSAVIDSKVSSLFLNLCLVTARICPNQLRYCAISRPQP